jgi:hypothetical protein
VEFGIFQNAVSYGQGLSYFLSELNEKINFMQEWAYKSSIEQDIACIFLLCGLFDSAVNNSDNVVPMIGFIK